VETIVRTAHSFSGRHAGHSGIRGATPRQLKTLQSFHHEVTNNSSRTHGELDDHEDKLPATEDTVDTEGQP
jgi:hypothetical protein